MLIKIDVMIDLHLSTYKLRYESTKLIIGVENTLILEVIDTN